VAQFQLLLEQEILIQIVHQDKAATQHLDHLLPTAVVEEPLIQDKVETVVEHPVDQAAAPHIHTQAVTGLVQQVKDILVGMLQEVPHMHVQVAAEPAVMAQTVAALAAALAVMAEVLVLLDIQHGTVVAALVADMAHKAMADMAD
jgi:hypothetical protein